MCCYVSFISLDQRRQRSKFQFYYENLYNFAHEEVICTEDETRSRSIRIRIPDLLESDSLHNIAKSVGNLSQRMFDALYAYFILPRKETDWEMKIVVISWFVVLATLYIASLALQLNKEKRGKYKKLAYTLGAIASFMLAFFFIYNFLAS